ncbi:MAG: c-type cytochrome [Alicyclobacillus herbarius]|uniref:menaquinol-cytochrome c reductase cytochrome b/c subunit n=1 Tax=Alicyclobacillus herbarius TaxID=122960 RepID=UPI00235353C4|nr:c-type cytochrome [Alicyclobacillus herbarius]MCL6631424.1 c-type cytochrome [Alicyclobacillus herbarius]
MAEGERIPGTPRYRHSLNPHSGYEPFFPNFLLKEWIVGAVFLLAFMLWIIFNPVELGPKANPDDTTFIPIPDWYFLFLYQILKYYPGSQIVVGVVLVPMIGTLLLLFTPWLDVSKERHPYKRPIATAAMVLVTFLVIWLTNEARVQHLAETGQLGGGQNLPQLKPISASQIKFTNTNMPGYKLFESTCAACHGKSGEGHIGPPIYAIGHFWNQQQLKQFVEHPQGGMPPRGGLSSDQQVDEVVAWLVKQKHSGGGY